MKQFLVVLMLLCPVGLMAQTKNAAKDFPLTVKVTASRWIHAPKTFEEVMPAIQIDVLISGKRYELEASPQRYEGLIAPGDYKARVIKSKHQMPAYELNQGYELQFPDGKTQQFALVAVGE